MHKQIGMDSMEGVVFSLYNWEDGITKKEVATPMNRATRSNSTFRPTLRSCPPLFIKSLKLGPYRIDATDATPPNGN